MTMVVVKLEAVSRYGIRLLVTVVGVVMPEFVHV